MMNLDSEGTSGSTASIEKRSLLVGMIGNLVMAIAGVAAAVLSRSDALLVDGLYSAINFAAALVAIRIGRSVARAPDPSRPFGYDADEAIYITFRSMVLIGILVFAAAGALEKVYVYAVGGSVPELRFGPIAIYAVGMVVICAGLAFWHWHNWGRTNGESEILKTEARAAIVDGAISGAAGGALIAIPLLKGTTLSVLVPVADSIIVLLLVPVIGVVPIRSFLGALGEIAGKRAPRDTIALATDLVEKILQRERYQLVELAVTRLGRTGTIVVYATPSTSVDATEVDALAAQVKDACSNLFAKIRAEVVITRKRRTIETGR